MGASVGTADPFHCQLLLRRQRNLNSQTHPSPLAICSHSTGGEDGHGLQTRERLPLPIRYDCTSTSSATSFRNSSTNARIATSPISSSATPSRSSSSLLSEQWASGDDGPEKASGDDGPEATCPEMTAARVSEHRLRRQSSVFSP